MLALILKYDTISLRFYIFSTSPVFRYCPVGLLPFSGGLDQSYRWPVLMGTQLHVSGWNTGRLQKLSPYKQKIINAQLCMQGLDRLVRNDKNWINCKWVYCYLVHIYLNDVLNCLGWSFVSSNDAITLLCLWVYQYPKGSFDPDSSIFSHIHTQKTQSYY